MGIVAGRHEKPANVRRFSASWSESRVQGWGSVAKAFAKMLVLIASWCVSASKRNTTPAT